ncbi:MAG TPA: protein kinase [Anaeromyxobacteraceae bacterium]|nr:protein kinase [Anaeromyxobacteraceae bacterium]
MGGNESQGGSTGPAEGVPLGALSALLREIAAGPTPPAGGWASALRPGAVFGKFELVRQLGRGGFGEVWEARDRELGRSVAFKAVRAGARAGLREERLLREAEAAARLGHPNLVTLFELGKSDHGPYLILELLQGQTLEERLSQGRLSLREVVRIAAEISKGVAHAHSQGVVHRDLKPGNVFLCEDGQVKVLDFGLAHAFGQRRQEGGTPAYMAPEQWEGAPEDERTDVFALGVMLYRLLSGEMPFPEDGGRSVQGPRKAPLLEVGELPAIGELVARMLAKRPAERPRDGAEVAASLRALHDELERTPTGGTTRVRTRRSLLGRSRVIVAAALLAVAGPVVWRLWPRAPAPGVGSDARIVVAVADTANETGERELDALSGLLVAALEQSPGLSVVPRGRLFDLARQAGHRDLGRIDEIAGREAGRRAGVRALLVTSVHRLGSTYAMQLRALDPANDRDLFSDKGSVPSKEAIYDLVDRLADRTRAELLPGEVRARPAPSTRAVTSSLEAYEQYFRGRELAEKGDVEAAAAAYRRSLEKDPRFALAHRDLSIAVKALGATDVERRKHAEAALAGADTLPERERLLTQAWHAQTFWRFEESRRLHRTYVDRFGDDKRTLVRVGGILCYLQWDAEYGQKAAEKALLLDPLHAPARELLVDALVEAERPDEALAEARRWMRELPSPQATAALVYVLRSRGDLDAALRAIAAGEGLPGLSAVDRARLRQQRAYVHLYRDDLEAARREVEARVVPVAAHEWGAFSFPAELAYYRGRPREAERLLEAPGAFEQWALYVRFELLAAGGPGLALRAAARAVRQHAETADMLVAVVLALAGEHELAAEVASSPNAAADPSIRRLVEALRRRGSDLAAARGELDEIRRTARPYFVRQAATYALGEACYAAGDDRCAIEMLRAFGGMYRHHWRLVSRAWAYPRSLLLVARSQERLGDATGALATVEHLLGMWRHAEPDFAPLAEARSLRARLAAAGKRTSRPAPAARSPTSEASRE